MADKSVSLQGNKSVLFTNRQLVTLMWPLLLEQMLAIAVGLADSLMVATVGDAAISAVSLVDSISNLMIYIFSAMATGGAAVSSSSRCWRWCPFPLRRCCISSARRSSRRCSAISSPTSWTRRTPIIYM